jgi:hypothetical protein
MTSAAGIIIAAGAITLANDMLQDDQPLTSPASKTNWRVIPATAVAAIAFAGIQNINKQLGVGLAWVALATTLLAPFGTNKAEMAPLSTLAKLMGYSGAPIYKGQGSTSVYHGNGVYQYDPTMPH